MPPYVRNKEARFFFAPPRGAKGNREHKIGNTNYLLKIQVLANT